MENHFPLSIPTKPFLKKYLHALYGSPLIFDSNTYFGIIVAGLLQRPNRYHRSPEVLQFRVFDKFTDKIDIYIPKWWLKKYEFGHTLSEKQILTLNKLFEERFEEDLCKHCAMAFTYHVEIKKAIEDFCARHYIEIYDDISFDALLKKEYRYRKNKQKKNESDLPKIYSTKNIKKNIPPSCPPGL